MDRSYSREEVRSWPRSPFLPVRVDTPTAWFVLGPLLPLPQPAGLRTCGRRKAVLPRPACSQGESRTEQQEADLARPYRSCHYGRTLSEAKTLAVSVGGRGGTGPCEGACLSAS